MAEDSDTTPRRGYRIGGLPGYIPLNDELPHGSTRGQRLPGLIQSRSNTSLFTLRDQGGSLARSASFAKHPDEEAHARPTRRPSMANFADHDARRMSTTPEVLMTPQMRSMRLIGNSNPRYRWEQYYKSEDELKQHKKRVKQYYERNNYLVAQYLYIDRLLDSSLPHNLIQEYHHPDSGVDVPQTITEEPSMTPPAVGQLQNGNKPAESENKSAVRVKRTPKNLYKVPDEETPLLANGPTGAEIQYGDDEGVDSDNSIVTVAIYINLVANFILLLGKIAVIVLTSSLSVLASLVDAALDFLSTAIVWSTTKLIARQDQYAYPVGRRRLEPVGVLVFSVIMITAFFQVALQCFNRLNSGDHTLVELTLPAICIMAGTVVIKGLCWLWCRSIKNSSVQALAQDAQTDVVFNIFSIIFPLGTSFCLQVDEYHDTDCLALVGFYAKIWWLDALGGLLLSFYVIFNWSSTSSEHIRNLTGAAATADQRNVLLYLTMRFAKTIRHIQGLQAYHAGDKLNVEVDIVLDENMSLRDTHDLGESLQYVLESVPIVDRAFVHADYAGWNLPSHMNQQS